MSLYKTEITIYHGEEFSEVDKSVLVGQVGCIGMEALAQVFWIECSQRIVAEGELVEDLGGGLE